MTTQNDRNIQVTIVNLCKNRFWGTGSAILGGILGKKWQKVQFHIFQATNRRRVLTR